MTFDWITKAFIAPVFFYMFFVMMLLTAGSIYAALVANTSYVILAGILFVLGFNSFRVGWNLMRPAAPPQLFQVAGAKTEM